MPQLGESVVEGTVGRWLKKEGDKIDAYEGLLEVESDKVDSEIPSPAGGTILKIYVPEGQTVQAGTVLAIIGEPGEKVPDAPAPISVHGGHGGSSGHEEVSPVPMSAPPPMRTGPVDAEEATTRRATEPVQQVKSPQAPPVERRGGNGSPGPRVSPVVANIAAEHGIDPSQVPGTGQGGRVTKKDIMTYIEQMGSRRAPTREADLAPWEQPGSGDLFKPTDDLYKTGGRARRAAAPRQAPADHVHQAPRPIGRPGEVVPLSKIRRRIAEHMVESALKIAPHVTTVFECDLSKVIAHRRANKSEFERRGVNLTFTPYFVAAAARALRAHPMVNSSWTDEGILLHPDVNIGMAVAIDDGLIVPVIKHADEMSLAGLSRGVNDLSQRARAGQLSPDDVQGGTFTITNHGVPAASSPRRSSTSRNRHPGRGAIQKRVVDRR
jgi:2-oxoglutarate dehydrogenase E2 component (dihydrolipoamide succinyltransferase)